MEHEGDGDTDCNWCAWNNSKSIDKGIGRLENKGVSGDNSVNRIVKIGPYTEKNSGDLRIFAVTQTPVRKTI